MRRSIDELRTFYGEPTGALARRLLARRLDSLNKYLVDVRHQFAGDGHLGMVDDVLDTLMHRQPRKRIPPKPSALDAP